MELFASPAALGGILTLVALGAWMLGRWQGGAVRAERARGAAATPVAGPPASPPRHDGPALSPPPPASLCQQAAQAERRGVLETAASLGDLHAEISAYRRKEQVLAGMEREQLDLVLVPVSAGQECRYLGVSGQPTCPMPSALRQAQGCGCGCAGFASEPLRAAQPSAAPSDFTRV